VLVAPPAERVLHRSACWWRLLRSACSTAARAGGAPRAPARCSCCVVALPARRLAARPRAGWGFGRRGALRVRAPSPIV